MNFTVGFEPLTIFECWEQFCHRWMNDPEFYYGNGWENKMDMGLGCETHQFLNFKRSTQVLTSIY